MKFSKELLI